MSKMLLTSEEGPFLKLLILELSTPLVQEGLTHAMCAGASQSCK